MTTAGKFTAGIAGMTGAGSLGLTTTVVARIASVHAIPAEIWAVLALLSVTTAVVAGLGLVLDYECAKLALDVQAGTARLRADLERDRMAAYRGLVEKSTDAAGDVSSFRDLLLADALHLAVEQNGVRPTDRTHGRLYHPRSQSGPLHREASSENSGTAQPE